MSISPSVFNHRRVLVTGHTGFKGAWLCEWLLELGAEVWGFSLPPPTQPSLFELLGLAQRMNHAEGDILDLAAVQRRIGECRPHFVFHLAAQPLVRLSYSQPVETFATNVMGTVHIMEALRHLKSRCVAVMVTTDKCYENREWLHSYREEDPLGGHDPYSASKAAAEITISAYRRSFFSGPESLVSLASTRAGNVIGGGDWALDRIFPDCMRALSAGLPIKVRNPSATRPWQHVLEPLSGYLFLAAALERAAAKGGPVGPLSAGFNFGPSLDSNRPVRDVVTEVLKHWPGRWEDVSDSSAIHEARLLNLATDKAHHLLGWKPRWNFEQGIQRSVDWYRDAVRAGAASFTQRQIREYANNHIQQSLSSLAP